jgi:hypothetical protein
VPRYMFKAEDLAPLRRVIERPELQRILSRAVPVKQFAPVPKAVDVVVERLPIRVRTRANPQGVPLGEVNALVKKRVPGVASVLVRDGSLLVSWKEPPTEEMRDRLSKALTDREAFKKIQDRLEKPPAPSEEVLKQKLLAATTTDDEWLRTFRTYQTKKLAAERPPKK